MGILKISMKISTAGSLLCTAVRLCSAFFLPISLSKRCKALALKLPRICDLGEGSVELWDQSSNFWSENDFVKNTLVSVQKLQKLNNAVVVTALLAKLTQERFADFQNFPAGHYC